MNETETTNVVEMAPRKVPTWTGSHCGFCRGTGARLGRHRDSKNIYAFNCDCRVGELKNRNWPTWSRRIEAEYDHWVPGE